MPAYLYRENVSPRERFTQIELQLDSGTTALILKGRSYDLSATEASRVQPYVVLQPVGSADSDPVEIVRLPVVGVPQEGYIPVWRDAYSAFVAEPNAGGGGGGGGGNLPTTSADTGESVRYIALTSDVRRVVPIPVGTPVPAAPTSLAASVHLSFVGLSWSGSADHFLIYRDSSLIASVPGSSHSYRDTSVAVSSTYSYTVRAVDVYGQWSPLSNAVSAFINPALNSSPTITITSWPELIPTHGTAIVRLNVSDADGQTLTIGTPTITSGGGTLTATDDPTVFLYTAP